MKQQILNRLSEPSTWTAIASMFGIFGIDLAADWAGNMAGGAVAVISAGGFIAAILMRDKSHDE